LTDIQAVPSVGWEAIADGFVAVNVVISGTHGRKLCRKGHVA
jgi:hypothetical protein